MHESYGLVRQSIISVDQQLTHPEGPTIVEQCMWLTLQAKRQRASSWKVQFKLPTNASVSDLPIPHKRKPKTMLQATRSKTEGVTLHTVRSPTQRVTETQKENENSRKREMTLFIHCQASKCSCICNSCLAGTHREIGHFWAHQFMSSRRFAILSNCGTLTFLSTVFESSCLRQVKYEIWIEKKNIVDLLKGWWSRLLNFGSYCTLYDVNQRDASV